MKRLLVLLPLLVAACGGAADSRPEPGTGVGTTAGPATAQTFTIRGTDTDQFDPATVQAKVGRLTLRLETGGRPHDLVFADRALDGIATATEGSPRTAVITLPRTGTFDFECTLHPGMTGKLVVS